MVAFEPYNVRPFYKTGGAVTRVATRLLNLSTAAAGDFFAVRVALAGTAGTDFFQVVYRLADGDPWTALPTALHNLAPGDDPLDTPTLTGATDTPPYALSGPTTGGSYSAGDYLYVRVPFPAELLGQPLVTIGLRYVGGDSDSTAAFDDAKVQRGEATTSLDDDQWEGGWTLDPVGSAPLVATITANTVQDGGHTSERAIALLVHVSGGTIPYAVRYRDALDPAGTFIPLNFNYDAGTSGVSFMGLPYGDQEIIFRVTDALGEQVSGLTFSWTVDPPATPPPTVSLSGSPANGSTTPDDDSYHTITVTNSTQSTGPYQFSYAHGDDTPGLISFVNVEANPDGKSASISLAGLRTGGHNLIARVYDHFMQSGDSEWLNWTRIPGTAGEGWDWLGTEGEDPFAGTDLSQVGIQIGSLFIPGLPTDDYQGPYLTDSEGQYVIPSWKGSDISFDELTGAIPTRKVHDSTTFSVPIEVDTDTVAEFRDALRLVAATAGEQGLPVRLLTPMGDAFYQDNAYVDGGSQWAIERANFIGQLPLNLKCPYPYWRDDTIHDTVISNGTFDLSAWAGSTAANERLLIQCISPGRITDVVNGSYFESPSAGTFDCATWTATGADLRFTKRHPQFTPFFVLSARGGQPRVTVTGTWRIRGYRRFLYPY